MTVIQWLPDSHNKLLGRVLKYLLKYSQLCHREYEIRLRTTHLPDLWKNMLTISITVPKIKYVGSKRGLCLGGDRWLCPPTHNPRTWFWYSIRYRQHLLWYQRSGRWLVRRRSFERPITPIIYRLISYKLYDIYVRTLFFAANQKGHIYLYNTDKSDSSNERIIQ